MVMGKMSGENVLQEVRQLKGDSLPVIAMSGTPWLMDKLLFDAVLPKPYSLKELFEMVQNFLSPTGVFIPASSPSQPSQHTIQKSIPPINFHKTTPLYFSILNLE
jgi:DNA-binding response OmpR family regulator